jgi:hypothetical protein
MTRNVAPLLGLLILLTAAVEQAPAFEWQKLYAGAPLNTDSDLVGFNSAMGISKACRYLAYLLIHEATHGLLESRMFPYAAVNRRRIERICHKEAVYFLSRFPKLAVEVLCLLNPGSVPKISRWTVGKRR